MSSRRKLAEDLLKQLVSTPFWLELDSRLYNEGDADGRGYYLAEIAVALADELSRQLESNASGTPETEE